MRKACVSAGWTLWCVSQTFTMYQPTTCWAALPIGHNQPLSLALGPDVPTAQAVSPLLASRQRVIDSLVVIYDLLDRGKNRAVSQEAVTFLSCAIYRIVRQLAAHLPTSREAEIFAFPPELACAMAAASMTVGEANLAQSLQKQTPESAKLFPLSSQSLTEQYPAHAPGLLNLIVTTEALFGARKKEKSNDKASGINPTL